MDDVRGGIVSSWELLIDEHFDTWANYCGNSRVDFEARNTSMVDIYLAKKKRDVNQCVLDANHKGCRARFPDSSDSVVAFLGDPPLAADTGSASPAFVFSWGEKLVPVQRKKRLFN